MVINRSSSFQYFGRHNGWYRAGQKLMAHNTFPDNPNLRIIFIHQENNTTI
jgi:hypothetical protein